MNDILQTLLELAITSQATDIHLYYVHDTGRVKLRTMEGLVEIDMRVSIDFFNYLKYISHLDLSQSFKPQSGIFSYTIFNTLYLCRFASIDLFNQFSGVIRILNLSKIKNVSDLSPQTDEITKLCSLARKQSGLILFTGTTGSGKTTTLFTWLKELHNKIIYTLEDPIECYYDHLIQIQINEQIGLTFHEGIKQLLRHDPDIIVIGEIRDTREAQAAIRCSYSGHLVMATLHSSSALGSIQRLLDFGITKQELKEVGLAIVYQQLKVSKQHQRYAQLEVLDYDELYF